jgi:hypothetical protein
MVKRVCDTGKEQKEEKQLSHFFFRNKKVSFTKFEKEDEPMNSPPTRSLCALEAVNVSNLMGIKGRIKDIGKNYFFLFAKIVSEKYQFGYIKRRKILC